MRGHGLTFGGARLPRRVTRGALAFSAAALLSFVLPVPGSSAVPCRDRVIADWSDNGRIDRSYPLACYRDAVTHMPEDLRTYSSAPDDIRQALTERRSLQRHTKRVAAPLRTAAMSPAPAGDGLPIAVVVPAIAGLLALLGVATWLARDRRRFLRR